MERGGSNKERALLDAFREIQILSDLAEDQLEWLVEHAEDLHLKTGDILFREGDPADSLFIYLDGEMHYRRESGGPDSPIYIATAGTVGGKLPFSRMTHFGGTSHAVLPTRIARISVDHFPEMLQRIPLLGQRLVAVMSDRIRETTKLDLQQEKMMALGKLSAGLAHELNNPAAAGRRAAASLRETLMAIRKASLGLFRQNLSIDQWESVLRFEREISDRVASSLVSDPLTLSDNEERINEWLDQQNVPEGWELTPVLAEAGLEIEALESFAKRVGSAALSNALIRVASAVMVEKLVMELEKSTSRISELVRAIKEYSYMDRASIQEIDLHDGIENTLIILGHRLKKGNILVTREYDRSLPRISANGSELNQVWTNLIDNAIDAMGGQGELFIRTLREYDQVLVEIADTGPGIPLDIQPHIFEPFYTTKGIGEGLGLGLDTVCRIVRFHHGNIRFSSKSGDTRFQVRLPINQPQ